MSLFPKIGEVAEKTEALDSKDGGGAAEERGPSCMEEDAGWKRDGV